MNNVHVIELIPTVEQIQDHSHSASISDDDLCAECSNCLYIPGELSTCTKADENREWPAIPDEQGQIDTCMSFSPLNKSDTNWHPCLVA